MKQRKCVRCGNDFYADVARIKNGGALYCSRICSNKSTSLRGEDSPHWKGDKVGYYGIHEWLYTNFGKANKCENPDCNHNSKRFQWAKLKGREYQRRRENFWQLCSSCHINYDETNLALRATWNKGKKWSEIVRQKISHGTKLGMLKAGYKVIL